MASPVARHQNADASPSRHRRPAQRDLRPTRCVGYCARPAASASRTSSRPGHPCALNSAPPSLSWRSLALPPARMSPRLAWRRRPLSTGPAWQRRCMAMPALRSRHTSWTTPWKWPQCQSQSRRHRNPLSRPRHLRRNRNSRPNPRNRPPLRRRHHLRHLHLHRLPSLIQGNWLGCATSF